MRGGVRVRASCGGARGCVSIWRVKARPRSRCREVEKNIPKQGGRGVAPRIAASCYLNSAPLVWSFLRGSRRREVELLSDAAPARCADMLARGQADAALVPVIEYQRLPEVAVVPGVCVGARREVRSVVLVTRGAELKDVRTVALDTSSRTSAALVEIIFREFYGREPRLESSPPDVREMLKERDAALVIGDPAMTFPREGLRVHDMAALWREHTGLGFVFAMWMTRGDAGDVGALHRLRRRARRGAGERRRDRRVVRARTAAAARGAAVLPARQHLLPPRRGDAGGPRTLLPARAQARHHRARPPAENGWHAGCLNDFAMPPRARRRFVSRRFARTFSRRSMADCGFELSLLKLRIDVRPARV